MPQVFHSNRPGLDVLRSSPYERAETSGTVPVVQPAAEVLLFGEHVTVRVTTFDVPAVPNWFDLTAALGVCGMQEPRELDPARLPGLNLGFQPAPLVDIGPRDQES